MKLHTIRCNQMRAVFPRSAIAHMETRINDVPSREIRRLAGSTRPKKSRGRKGVSVSSRFSSESWVPS